MKILIDGLQVGNRSGTGTYTGALLRHLPEVLVGSEVHAVCPAGLWADYADSGPTAVYPSSMVPPPIGTVTRSLSMLWRIRRVRPDVMHYPANFSRWVGAGLLRRTKVVLTVHDLSFLRNPEWFRWDRSAYYRSVIRRSVGGADLILADSEATAADLREFLGTPPERIRVIPLGVDAQYAPVGEGGMAEVRERYGLPERFFLYLGTIEPRKNLPCLIEAFDRIAGEIGEDLVIAGRFGWKVEASQQALANAIHRHRIHLPGFVADADLPALLSAAEAFVWPSLWEGFGLPPLEAMACGTPVVTSNVASLPEVVGDAAVLVDPADVDALAQAMNDIVSDAAVRERLTRRGRERAAQFTWRKTAELTAAAYRDAVGRS